MDLLLYKIHNYRAACNFIFGNCRLCILPSDLFIQFIYEVASNSNHITISSYHPINFSHLIVNDGCSMLIRDLG